MKIHTQALACVLLTAVPSASAEVSYKVYCNVYHQICPPKSKYHEKASIILSILLYSSINNNISWYLSLIYISCSWIYALVLTSLLQASSDASIVDLSKDFEVDDAAVKSSPGSQAIMEYGKNKTLIRTIMVLDDGKVVAKYIRDDVDENKPHDVMSVTKSWTSLLIGMIIEEGKLSLNTTLGSIFPNESAWELSDEADFRKLITVSCW